jgi:alpha-mannosidase
MDWRKRVVFSAGLEPSSMNRFDCRVLQPTHSKAEGRGIAETFLFESEQISVLINGSTGLVDSYRVDGVEFVGKNAFAPIVIQDSADPWGMKARRFGRPLGRFQLLSPQEGAELSGIPGSNLESVRIIEDGEVRTVVEAVFGYNRSTLCQRYFLPKGGTELGVELRVYWNEKDKMLKWILPCPWSSARCIRQVAFGSEELPGDGEEAVFQKWAALVSDPEKKALTCINDGIYGLDFSGEELRFSLLRSPAYSALPSEGELEMPKDRFLPRIDQGERTFTFWVRGGDLEQRLQQVGREAAVHNEPPFLLPFHPAGRRNKVQPLIELHDEVIELSAFKQAHTSEDFIVRLFEPTGKSRSTVMELPCLGIRKKLHMKGFEVKTYKLSPEAGTLEEVSLPEHEL